MESIAATGSSGSVGSAMSDTSGNIQAILPSSSPAEGHDRRAGYISSFTNRIPSIVCLDRIISVVTQRDRGGGSMQRHHPHSR